MVKNLRFIFLCILFFSNILFPYDKPNIVIIVSDDLGWGDVSYHESVIPTPNIDRFVNEGLELNRFYSNPICSPTRASLMTGLEAYSVGILGPIGNPSISPVGLPLEYKILPEYFKDAGYQTALVGKWHLGMNSKEYLPGQRGFDTTYGFMNGGIDYFKHTMSGRLDWHKNGVPLREEGYSTDLIANEAIKVIQNKKNNKPLLLYIAFNAPHTPVQAPYENIENFDYIDDPKERIYAANISILDKQIGKIIDSIEDQQISSNTLILFFSDNGPVFDIDPIGAVIVPDLLDAKGSTGGLKGSKGSAYEGGIRVPAFMMWKGKFKNESSNQFFFIQDVLPTLLSAADIDYENDIFEGTSRWDSFLKQTVDKPKNSILTANTAFEETALFNKDWKLYFKKGPAGSSSVNYYELFNILEDPYEKNDLSKDHPDVFDQMKETLNKKPKRNLQGYPNASYLYLHGDRMLSEESGTPWLNYEFEMIEKPSPIIGTLIFIWILLLANKTYAILVILLTIFLIYSIRKKIKRE